MKKVTSLIILVFVLNISNIERLHAMDLSEIKRKIRPYIRKYLGNETTGKMVGEEIVLPVIPKINNNALSEKVYSDKKIGSAKVPENIRGKFDQQFIKEVFITVREQKPSDDDFKKWLNVLSQGATREGVYRALVLDDVYGTFENYVKKKFNKESIEFVIYFFNKFINIKFSEKRLVELNFHQAKRVVTEKALELMDELKKNPEDLYSWYAVLSSDFALDFSSIWKNNLRKDCSRERHFKWAQSVPEQNIKSEIIIKIHMIFNNLSTH